ncbi:hypothetical protein QQS21_000899 [Conoideocrella luteorostrata]|uniref:Beta-lactamase/transpeptidase-like protein n=1 Tax=Conoideocrella luteorostrata TaxID=1105319 RepID=A0AAJ0FY60_9HYPO|nr:hypothetical protein QQS21_000899 [Conoideocrella luteorostrata]
MSVSKSAVEDALRSIAPQHRGPGGAVAVLQDGAVLGQHVWGYADLDEKIPLAADTLMPICSISKQLFCALVVDLQRNPTPAMAANGDVMKQFSNKLAELLPSDIMQSTGLTIDHLCSNHSGIRDYWALTALCGAKPEGEFSIAKHGPLMRERLRSVHFQPGTEFSYANTNFHILGRVLEEVTKESLDDLLAQRIFAPAGMKTARLCADTAKLPKPCVGYEGDAQHGFRPATNRIEWAGDAGVIASLDDMVAYEAYLDRSLSDPESWYRAVMEPGKYSDGKTAKYHYGLGHGVIEDVSFVGHGGALRGFRLNRMQVPKARLSIVVMLNHEANTSLISEEILRKVLKLQSPPPQPTVEPSPAWTGTFLDQDTQLAVSISRAVKKGQLSISYAVSPETVIVKEPDRAASRSMNANIDGDIVTLERLIDNRTLHAKRLAKDESVPAAASFAGSFYCKEIDSTFHCDDLGGILYGSFDGFLGHGPAEGMRHLGQDVWALPCARGMDAPAPGDWTLVFRRGADRSVIGVTIGCWLARKLEYNRVG